MKRRNDASRIISAASHTEAVLKTHRKVRNRQFLTGVLAVLVLLGTIYPMILPALTMAQETYCGQEEHTHTATCYEQRLVCETEESAEHEHGEACYEKVLSCTKTEHTHSTACYSNPNADLEGQTEWARSVSDVALTGGWAEDLVAVAKSQLGYSESTKNYIVGTNGEKQGYTRYGAWYGDAYADWDAMFVSFCLQYAGIPSEKVAHEAKPAHWVETLKKAEMYEEVEGYVPAKGDLIFFQAQDGASGADHVGIVSEVLLDKDEQPVKLSIIEGDTEDKVVENTYAPNDKRILGYGKLPEATERSEAKKAQSRALAAESAQLLADAPVTRAANGLYVGFSKAFSTGAIDFARGGDGGGVRKYYLIPQSVYSQYAGQGVYAAQQAVLGQAEVAYCYNYYNKTPYTFYENAKYPSTATVAYYNEKENASASLFYSSTSTHRRTMSQSQLYQKILAMAMNGYPNDYSGIGRKYNLTDDEFRFVTQYAIWYYTDSISVNFATQSGNPYFYMYADDTRTWLTVNESGKAIMYGYSNPNVRLAYQTLIASSLDSATVNTSHINLYKNTTGAFQNLLTVGQEEAPPPQQEPNRLKLKKIVGGSLADSEKEFNFTISLQDQNFSSLNGTYKVIPEADTGVTKPTMTSITFRNGTATVKLKHGQSITIDGLPDNFFYTISEAEWNQEGYTSEVTEGTNTNLLNGDGGLGTIEVVFENRKEAPPTITKVQIPAKKTIDGGNTPIGENRFKFHLTGHGQDLYAYSDEKGEVLFPEIVYTQPGTYTYTIEEIPDERDGVSFDFDKSTKTITVTISEHDVQTYDPDATYYAFEEMNEEFEYYYYVDTVPGRKGIVMYCTNQGISGPQDLKDVPARDQTYKVVINPTVSEIVAKDWVQQNLYGEDLSDNLKKLFYYFETTEGKKISNSDKQSLVWSATGKKSSISSIRVNGRPASSNATTVLNNIYETVTPPPYYNLAFFIPTEKQALDSSQGGHPQPLATGYGAVVETTSGEAVFNNTTKVQNRLKLSKNVSGSAGDKEKLFNFSILLRNQYLSSLSGTFDVIPGAIDGVDPPEITQITFSGGYAEVNLKHGQNITITGLPDGFYYGVNEMNAEDYTVSTTGDPNANWTASQGVSGMVDITFENYKEAPPEPPSYQAEIKVNKTLNGEAPADKQFTFILRNAAGEEIDRRKNDANGEVVFPLTITEPGTFTYTVEELNDHQEGIVYDTERKTVTVTVSSEKLQEIVNGENFVGSGTTGNFKITVNGDRALDVYCIDGSVGNPFGTYDKVLNPTNAQLASEVTVNYYGTSLETNMRKLLYYFDTHSYTDQVKGTEGYSITLSKTGRQELIWCLTGNPGEQHISYKDPLNKILAESNPPSDYAVVMFASQNTPKAQPVIAGYLPSMNVVYEGETGMVKFENFYEYELPETGGGGTAGYIAGGLVLMSGALLLLAKTKLGRKKEGDR